MADSIGCSLCETEVPSGASFVGCFSKGVLPSEALQQRLVGRATLLIFAHQLVANVFLLLDFEIASLDVENVLAALSVNIRQRP